MLEIVIGWFIGGLLFEGIKHAWQHWHPPTIFRIDAKTPTQEELFRRLTSEEFQVGQIAPHQGDDGS